MVFTVELDANPKTGIYPLTVTFSGKISDYVASLEWLLDYRDGAVEWGEPPAPASFTVEHTYEKPGTYEAVLGSHDAGGHEAFARVKILVTEKPPVEWWIIAAVGGGAVVLIVGGIVAYQEEKRRQEMMRLLAR